jgi:hypothetical protein
VDPFPSLIAHHLSPISITLELILLLALLVGFGSIWWKERRRRLRQGGTAHMRDDD